MLKVLGRSTSINVRKVLWALDELGLAYEQEDWGLPLCDPQTPEFLALNPNGQVPVLIDGDLALWESNAILIYLADREGRLLPRKLEDRGRTLQWLGWQASDLNTAWRYAVLSLIRKAPGYGEPDALEDSVRRWTRAMGILEGQLGRTGPFVAGDEISIADIALGLSVHRWMSVPIDRLSLPAVEAYYKRLGATEAGARWMTSATP
jgi:glutathione S-transferase